MCCRARGPMRTKLSRTFLARRVALVSIISLPPTAARSVLARPVAARRLVGRLLGHGQYTQKQPERGRLQASKTRSQLQKRAAPEKRCDAHTLSAHLANIANSKRNSARGGRDEGRRREKKRDAADRCVSEVKFLSFRFQAIFRKQEDDKPATTPEREFRASARERVPCRSFSAFIRSFALKYIYLYCAERESRTLLSSAVRSDAYQLIRAPVKTV